MQTITLPLEQAQALRQYLGTRPFDEVCGACSWLDHAIQTAAVPPFMTVSDRDRELDDLASAGR